MIREVLRMGDPQLLQRSTPVDAFGTPELAGAAPGHARHDGGAERRRPRRAADRRAAAGRHLRRSSTTTRYPDAEAVPYTELVNPVLTPLSDEIDEDWEGCLSVPGLRGIVPRYTALALRGLRPATGSPIRREVDGFHARVVQHECDHLRRHSLPDAHARHVALRLHRHPLPGQRAATRSSGSCAPRRVSSSDPQLLVERRLEPQHRLLVVQPRAVDQEHVLGALAERVDLRARRR